MATPEKPSGVIKPNVLYTLEGLKSRIKVTNATLRSARRAGLRVHYKHGRGFILGRDWIDYVTSSSSLKSPPAAAQGGT